MASIELFGLVSYELFFSFAVDKGCTVTHTEIIALRQRRDLDTFLVRLLTRSLDRPVMLYWQNHLHIS